VLIILELLSNVDVSVDIAVIKDITIVKKSKALEGVLIGGALGALFGYATYKEPSGFTIDLGPGGNALGGAMLGGIAGLGIGLLHGTDETLQIEGKSIGEVRGILENLRSKARIPDFN